MEVCQFNDFLWKFLPNDGLIAPLGHLSFLASANYAALSGISYIFKSMKNDGTVETRYNEILGTEIFCLLYQIFCYISSQ